MAAPPPTLHGCNPLTIFITNISIRSHSACGILSEALTFINQVVLLTHACVRIYLQLQAVLAKIDDWQFDSFELHEVSGGRPLSTLAFAILNRFQLVPGRHHLHEVRPTHGSLKHSIA